MGGKKSRLTLLLILCLVFSACVLAQEELDIKNPNQTSDYALSLWGLVSESGLIGWIIMLVSVATMALTIEHIFSLRRDKLIPPDLLQDIEDLFEDEAYEEVMETCNADPGYLTNVIWAALERIDSGYDSMVKAVHSVGEEESVKLQQKISWLQLISSIAPMLGLLGTVTGMIAAFWKIANLEGAPKPKDLAGGIFQALVTTCMGIGVAIPAMSIYFYFRNKVVRISMEINGVAEELLGRFRQEV